MTAAFLYKKLPGVRRGLIRKASLWEGTDHLLSVSGTRFFEQYRRFYYPDIQALLIQKCARPGSIGVWLLTVLFCAVSALLGKATATPDAPVWVHRSLWALSSVLFLYLVYRLVVSLKYSCRCYIQTAVAWEELPSLYRTWNTRKALGRIREKIAEAQGPLTADPQVLTENFVEQTVVRPFGFSQATSAAGSEAGRTEENGSIAAGVNWALSGCIALLVIAAFLFWFMDMPAQYTSRLGIIAANALLTLIAGGGFLVSLLRIYKARALQSLRNFLFAALSLVSIHIYFSSMLTRLYSQQDVISGALRSPAFRHWFSLIDGGFSLLLGISGVALIAFNWQNCVRRRISNV